MPAGLGVSAKGGYHGRMPLAERIRFFLVDDHALFAEGLALVIDAHPGWKVLGASPSGQAALAEILELRPEVAVVDAALPDLGGDALVRLLRARGYAGAVVALSSHADRATVLGMFAAGANAYVLKHNSGQELELAVAAALRGRTWFSRELSDMVMEVALDGQSDRGRSGLTEREGLVLSLLCADRSPKEIAHLLGISRKTVDNHKAHIMAKLGVASHTALILKAVERGLCRPEAAAGQ